MADAAVPGVVAALSFLVLVLGYRLLGGRLPGPAALLAVTVAVGVTGAGLVALLRRATANRRV
ncbi:MAG: hypothetical protein ABEJ08_01535 [Halobacteriaceae archaeon]